MTAEKVYVFAAEDFAALRAIADRLQGGNDAMRDEGHRLWLLLDRAAESIAS